MCACPSPRNQQLQDAFLAFNELSESLAGSYRDLETRVAQLTQELAAARSERLRQLAEKERLANRLAGLLEALPGGVLVVDASGYVQECNPAARALLGQLNTPVAWQALMCERLAPRPGIMNEYLLDDGRCVNVSVQTLTGDGGRIVLLTDLSETRALQESLQKSRHLSAMGEMVAGLAHQLRTPLASALLYMSHLRRPALVETDRLRIVERLSSRLHYMEKQINDMLLFARGGEATTETLSVSTLLDEFRHAVETQVADADVYLRIDNDAASAQLNGNPAALVGVLSNLASNAMQTGARPLHLRLAVTCDHEEYVCFRFSDDGPGMDSNTIKKAFQPFYTTRSEGVGLGLAVVQTVIHAHGGRVSIDSTPGRGCCFTLDLPRVRPQRLLASGTGTEELICAG